MRNRTRTRSLSLLTLILCALAAVGGGFAPSDDSKSRKTIKVTNIVPKGAQPIKAQLMRIEILDAVDIEGTHWHFKVAVRIRSTHRERVKCSLKMLFDGESMGQPWPVDLRPGQSDLVVFGCYCAKGKGASQLTRLTAEATNIRIGE